jgi:hypothetical protein
MTEISETERLIIKLQTEAATGRLHNARDAVDLEALNIRASGGRWSYCGQRTRDEGCSCGYVFGNDGEAFIMKALTLDDGVDPAATPEAAKANAEFVVALVNLYRSGKLVYIP